MKVFGDSTKILPISSLTKQFTAAAILLLPQVKLDDSILEFISTGEKFQDVTIRDLLNHTSGIEEYLYKPSIETLQTWSLDDCVEFISKLEVIPNDVYRYSNSNYVLLSKIIEVASSKSYEHFVKERLLAPEILQNTFLPVDFTNGFYGWGDACMFSCVGDLQKWYRSQTFQNYLEKIQKIVRETSKSQYCAGLFKGECNQYFHSGSKPGSASFAYINPTEKSSFVFLYEGDATPVLMENLHKLFQV